MGLIKASQIHSCIFHENIVVSVPWIVSVYSPVYVTAAIIRGPDQFEHLYFPSGLNTNCSESISFK